jgi:hypothetical protein
MVMSSVVYMGLFAVSAVRSAALLYSSLFCGGVSGARRRPSGEFV